MQRFLTKLVSGKKRPYESWTFIHVPPEVTMNWGSGRKAVRGSISGHTFQGTASRGEGAVRVPIPRDFRELARLNCGDTVEVALELDPTPRPVLLPVELQDVLKDDPEIAALFEKLPPSMRRAWATYVADARRPETRLRRASQAPGGIRTKVFP